MDTSDELLPTSELVSLSVELASAYVSNNSVPASDLPKLLSEIHGVLRAMNGSQVEPTPAEVKPAPAVSAKKSVTPDFIICLEDGKSFKSLKRHLQTKFGLTPQQYREKWNLPPDYPMVAPNYAAARSAFARANGLGQLRAAQTKSAAPVAADKIAQTVAQSADDDTRQKRRGDRPSKAGTAAPATADAPETSSHSRPPRKSSSSASAAKPKRAPRKLSGS